MNRPLLFAGIVALFLPRILVAGSPAAGTAAPTLDLVSGGASDYEIVVAQTASEGVREAAHELQRLISAATTVRLPIVGLATASRHHIVVGAGELAAKAGLTDAGLGPDSYVIRAMGANLFFVGRDDARQPFFTLNNQQSASAGTYYAVLDFARRFLGARWYMPGPLGEDVGSLSRLIVPADLDLRGHPHFLMRYVDITSTKTPEQENRLFAQGTLKARYFSQANADIATRWGRHLRLGSNFELNVEHAWYRWLPAERPTPWSGDSYGRSHPEYYAVPGGRGGSYYYGRDGAHGGQLCIYRGEVAQALATQIVSYARRTGERSFSLSPNDGDWDVDVGSCGPLGRPIAEHGGSLTGSLVRFSNDVATRVLASIPDARFGLYAYHWTEEPPVNAVASSRIDVSDVHNGLPYAYQLTNQRRELERLIRGWRRAGGRVTLTTYYSFEGNYSLPWSTPEVQEWLIALLRSSPNSGGLRMNYAPLDFPPMGVVGSDPWVLSEMLWDPGRPIRDLEAEFYTGAFGPIAGPLIASYYDAIGKSMRTTIAGAPYRELNGVRSYIEPAYGAVRAQCRALIEAALAAVAADSERYRWRVDQVARGWKLTESTLDALAASRSGSNQAARAAWAARRHLLNDPGSRLSLAAASSDVMESEAPLDVSIGSGTSAGGIR